MKNFLLFTSITFVSSVACIHSKKSQFSWIDDRKIQTQTKEHIPEAEIRELDSSTNPLKIIKAEITGNYMEFEVSYSGGCKKHEFKLVGSPILTKSLPPIRTIQLEHDNKGDKCKAIKIEKLKFSISNLSENDSKKEIKLFLNNNQVSYSYFLNK